MRPFFNQDNLNIRILNFLEKQNNCTFTELANDLTIDRATLTKTIKELALKLQRLSQNDIQIALDNQGITYQRKPDFNLASLMPMLSDHRIAIIFESSFNQHYANITALANKLYVSESTTRRLLKQVNETLTNYRIQIDLKTLRFTGKEENIRYMAFQYYWNTYGSVTWPFAVNELEMRQLANDNQIPNYDQLRFSFWLAICKSQQLKHHSLNEADFITMIKAVDFKTTDMDTIRQYATTFGNIPLLYDRETQLEDYLQTLTTNQKVTLAQQTNNQKLLMLKLCESGIMKNRFKFKLRTDSDNFGRKRIINQIQNHFDNYDLIEVEDNPDFVLTNLTLRNSNIPIVYINVPLENSDYQAIEYQLKQCLK